MQGRRDGSANLLSSLATNLLKLTDYPFSYSLIGLLLLTSGHKVDIGILGPFIFIVGLFGTTLSITDPFGRLVKLILGIFLSAHQGQEFQIKELSGRYRYLAERSLSTNWISYEIDKLVSTVYFLILLGVICVIMISNNQNLVNNFLIFSGGDSSICGTICDTNGTVRTYVIIFSAIAIVGIVIVVIYGVRKIIMNSKTIISYISSVEILPALFKEQTKKLGNSDPALSSDVQTISVDIEKTSANLLKYIEMRDWSMAQVFASNILDKERLIEFLLNRSRSGS